AVDLDPNHPMALKHLFQVRMNLNMCDEATLGMAERLVRLAPDFVESWSELSWIYFELGRSEECVAVLEQFLSEHPHSAEGHAAFAWRLGYLQRNPEARDHARRAYELEPHSPYVGWTLVTWALGEPCSDEEAAGWAEEVAARFPSDAFVLASIGGFY